MEEIALDTNVAIGLVKGDKSLSQKLIPIPNWFLPVSVVGELLYGAINSGKPEKNLAIYQNFIARPRILGIDEGTAEHYAHIRLQLKRSGRPIPENDIWIAAISIQRGLTLATLDKHFQYVENLRLFEF